MSYTSKQILERLSQLHAAGFFMKFEAGDKVARGFADLGFEEFFVLPGNRLSSTFTGEISQLKEGDEKHLFLIPDIDQVIAEAERVGLTFVKCEPLGELLLLLAVHVGVDVTASSKRRLRVEANSESRT